ncbi:beta-galactosidase [Halobacteria archaeon AArc-m2/3/4]|uniref:beta-galactosidase n=1 Tax=Natronoglomus mannanivorans TaxID=2979990 RepID=A0ABT2QBN8_9EURY|nr:beta-galactosidase [Halobacteria archaeon AArc-m2/3/4]
MDIGVCYFPEHWPRERWETDVEQMASAGIEYVRMGEFAWSVLEPEPGRLEFEWLETAVELVADQGMKAVLCTPTATPPKWLVDRHPEIRQEEPDGTIREYGGRRHYCFSSETYREQTARIVRELAERFADNPHVVGWQTDNEFGCHDTIRCYCEDCAEAFRDWLRERYGDIESLNDAWGTTFWSQHLRSFEEVDPPRHTTASHHPARVLDYHRFSSDQTADYNRLQAEILRSYGDWFVTHNFMYNFSQLNAFDVGDDLDFASWDAYPTGFPQVMHSRSVDEDDLRVGNPDEIGLNHDLFRCAADGPFWIMEQQPGEINWPPTAAQPAAGAMRLWAHHAVAHGADVVTYFRWRRCLEGQEQYHAGLRRADGSAARGYHDARRAASEFADLEALVDGEPEGTVAVLLDYDSLWALEEQPGTDDFDYWEYVGTYYTALRARGVTVDLVPTETDLSGYSAVIAPALHVLSESVAASISDYVENGGALLVTMRSGEKTPGNKLTGTAPPGPLADLVGASVTERESVGDSETLETRLEYHGESYEYRTWAEWLAVEDAIVAGEYTTGVGAGRAAITERVTGDGSVTYVGVWPNEELADALVTDLLARADATYTADRLPDRVRVAERGSVTWVFNYRSEETTIDVGPDGELLAGAETVPGYDLAVLEGTAADVTVEPERERESESESESESGGS